MGTSHLFRRLAAAAATTVLGTALLAASASAAPFHFTNPANIVISGGAPAATFPSKIEVSGLEGTVAKATATFSGMNGEADDLNALLVGPRGQNVMLMAFACQTSINNGISLTFDDSAASQLPETNCNATGTFKPSNFDGSPEALTPPAPGLPYGSQLAAFNGTDPNGTWSLFLENAGLIGATALEAGWSLDLETTAPIGPGGGGEGKKECPKGKKLKTVKKHGKKKKKCVKKKKKKGKK